MATVITNKGLALLAKLTQGKALNITCAKTGAGTVDDSLLQQQTGVTNQKQTMNIKSLSYPTEGKCALVLSVTNEGVATGYTVMQIGIFAQDPDEGEVLFSIWQIGNSAGINIPSEAVLPGYNAELSYYIKYDQADSVNVNVDPANTVSHAAMEAHVDSVVKSLKYAGSSSVGGPATSAAKLSTSRTIQVNLESTAAANFNGTANAAPGVTGTLPVANGGTGAASVFAAQFNLGIKTADEISNLHVWKVYREKIADGADIGYKIAVSDKFVFSYSDSISFVNGVFDLVNPKSLSVTDVGAGYTDALLGKYVKYNSKIYYIPENTYIYKGSFDLDSGITPARPGKATFVAEYGGLVAYDTKEHPDNGKSWKTDHWYWYQGQLGERQYTFGESDLTADASPLENGKIYLFYERGD